MQSKNKQTPKKTKNKKTFTGLAQVYITVWYHSYQWHFLEASTLCCKLPGAKQQNGKNNDAQNIHFSVSVLFIPYWCDS